MRFKINFHYLLIFFLLFIFMGCKDNPISPEFSIEDEINSNRPFDHINIFDKNVTIIYSNDTETGIRFSDASTENGYLVIYRDDKGKEIYNLSTAKVIDTDKGYVGLSYRY